MQLEVRSLNPRIIFLEQCDKFYEIDFWYLQ